MGSVKPKVWCKEAAGALSAVPTFPFLAGMFPSGTTVWPARLCLLLIPITLPCALGSSWDRAQPPLASCTHGRVTQDYKPNFPALLRSGKWSKFECPVPVRLRYRMQRLKMEKKKPRMKRIILVSGLKRLCQNQLCTWRLTQHPLGSAREGSSCSESPRPLSTHPLPTLQESWSHSLNHWSSSFIPSSSLRSCFWWELILVTQKSTISHGRLDLSTACGLIKEQRPGAQWKDCDARWSWGNGAEKRELPLLPDSSRHGAQAGAAQQGSVSWKRPKSALPKTCSVFA